MNPQISQFLHDLTFNLDTDYGDFKRESDLHLRDLIKRLSPLNEEQVWHLLRLREQLLWTYDFDIDEMKKFLRGELEKLESLGRSEPQ